MKVWPMFALCAALNGVSLGLELASDEKDFSNIMLHGGLTVLWGGLAYGCYREDEVSAAAKNKKKPPKNDKDRFDIM